MFNLERRKFVNSSALTPRTWGKSISSLSVLLKMTEFFVESVLDTFFSSFHFAKNTRTDDYGLVGRKKVQFIIFTILLLMTTTIHAQKAMNSQEILKFKENVKKVATQTKTISSNFDQYKHMEFLSDDIKTSGLMQFKSPNLVKWSYTKPFQYSIIFKEGKLLINDEGKKSDVNVGSNQLFKKLNQLIVKSISGDMFDDAEFTMDFFKNNTNYVVKFNSKDVELKKYIKQFELHFNKLNYKVIEVKMIEPSDDYTRIVFINRKENQTIKDEVFSN